MERLASTEKYISEKGCGLYICRIGSDRERLGCWRVEIKEPVEERMGNIEIGRDRESLECWRVERKEPVEKGCEK